MRFFFHQLFRHSKRSAILFHFFLLASVTTSKAYTSQSRSQSTITQSQYNTINSVPASSIHRQIRPFKPSLPLSRLFMAMSSSTTAGSSSPSTIIPSWTELQSTLSKTKVGKALDDELIRRKEGIGSPHVHAQLRLFGHTTEQEVAPPLTLYRDHAGWCPYCQKTMLLIEEKQIPIRIELINMRSYGDKPSEFLRKIPNGLLPALEVNNKGIITESAVIMQLLDEWHTEEDGYKPMVPSKDKQPEQYQQYLYLMDLERELFRWWCTFMFRPETPAGTGGNGFMNGLSLLGGSNNNNKNNNNNNNSNMSPQMKGFLDCLQQVNDAIKQTKGLYFLDFNDGAYPTMIDFVFASHVERMLASCAYWKGMNLRSPEQYPQFEAVQNWMSALEKMEYYLAFKSDYYTHIKDIPPQYGPSYDGIIYEERIQEYQQSILGKDNGSWTLPLSHDDELQPLYNGPPLPLGVLTALGIKADIDGSYMSADPTSIQQACRLMAAWKLVGNGPNISKFSSRGGPAGSQNPRKAFGAELADPYAQSDETVFDIVDAALRIIGLTIQDINDHVGNELPTLKYETMLLQSVVVSDTQRQGVISSLEYLRDRIGVPRDLPLAAARYLRAYLNWAVDVLQK